MVLRVDTPRRRLDRYFGISARGSDVGREVRGGVATFVTMSYIVVLNPLVLGGAKDAGGRTLPLGALAGSTALVAAVMTILMGSSDATRSRSPPGWGSTAWSRSRWPRRCRGRTRWAWS